MNEREKKLREKISRATPNLKPKIDVEDVAAILEELDKAQEVAAALVVALVETLPSCHHSDCLGGDNPKPAMWWSVERECDRNHTFQRCDEHKTADKYGLKYATNPTPWAETYRKALAWLETRRSP